jgi:hypothetical protein
MALREIILADTLADSRVAASRDLMMMRFASSEALDLALSLLEYYQGHRSNAENSGIERVGAASLRWTDREAFSLAVGELDDFQFKIRFPAAERRALDPVAAGLALPGEALSW